MTIAELDIAELDIAVATLIRVVRTTNPNWPLTTIRLLARWAGHVGLPIAAMSTQEGEDALAAILTTIAARDPAALKHLMAAAAGLVEITPWSEVGEIAVRQEARGAPRQGSQVSTFSKG